MANEFVIKKGLIVQGGVNKITGSVDTSGTSSAAGFVVSPITFDSTGVTATGATSAVTYSAGGIGAGQQAFVMKGGNGTGWSELINGSAPLMTIYASTAGAHVHPNLTVSGSIFGNVTGSLLGTSSWSTNTITSSFALSASYSSVTIVQQLYTTQSLVSTQSLWSTQSISAISSSWASSSLVSFGSTFASNSLFSSGSKTAGSAVWASSSLFASASIIANSSQFASGSWFASGSLFSSNSFNSTSSSVSLTSSFAYDALGTPTVTITAPPYNAVAGYSTDATTIIQSAIDYLNASSLGGIVFFPAGVYRVTGSIFMKTGVSLVGEKTKGQLTTGTVFQRSSTTSSMVYMNGVNSVKVKDICFYGGDSVLGIGLTVRSCSYFNIENCDFRNFLTGSGIYYSWIGTIRDCNMVYNSSSIILDNQANQITISENDIAACNYGINALGIGDCYTVDIRDNDLEANNTAVFIGQNCNNFTVQNNHMEAENVVAIVVTGSRKTCILRNTYAGGTSLNIMVTGSNAATIADNLFYDSTIAMVLSNNSYLQRYGNYYANAIPNIIESGTTFGFVNESNTSSFSNLLKATSSFAISASWAPGGTGGTSLQTGSFYPITASVSTTSSYSLSSSYSSITIVQQLTTTQSIWSTQSLSAISSSFASSSNSSSLATNAVNVFVGNNSSAIVDFQPILLTQFDLGFPIYSNVLRGSASYQSSTDTIKSTKFQGTASVAVSSSYALSASYLPANLLWTGSNLLLTQQLNISGTTTTSPILITGNTNNFFEINLENSNAGNNASTDIVATSDIGTANTYYVDLGINSSTYNANQVGQKTDSFLYSTGSNSSSLYIGAFDVAGGVYLFAGTNTGSGLIVKPSSITASYLITGSITNAISASWAPGGTGGTSLQTSSTYPVTASWAVNVVNGSNTPGTMGTGSTYPITASWASTASFVSPIGAYTTLTTNSMNWVTISLALNNQAVNLTTALSYNFTHSNIPTTNQMADTLLYISHSAATSSSLSFPISWKNIGTGWPASIAGSTVAFIWLRGVDTTTILGTYSVSGSTVSGQTVSASYALSSSYVLSSSYTSTSSYPGVAGNATLGYYPIWNSGTTLSITSSIFNAGNNIGIGTQTANITKVFVYDANPSTATGNVIGSRTYQNIRTTGTENVYGQYIESVGIGTSTGVSYGGTIYGSYVSGMGGDAQQTSCSSVIGQYVTAGVGSAAVNTGSVRVLSLNLTSANAGSVAIFFTTNAAILYLEPVTGSSNITNWWGIYQASPNDKNFIAANTGFGILPVTGPNRLQISGSISCSAAITSSLISSYFAPNRNYTIPSINNNSITLSFLTPEMYVTFSEGKVYTITCSNLPSANAFSNTRCFFYNTSPVTCSLVWGSGWKQMGVFPASASAAKSFRVELTAYAGTVAALLDRELG